MATARVCKFQKEVKELSYDCGQTWTKTSETRVIEGREPVERNSVDCGFGGEVKRTVVSGTVCNGYDKYEAVYDEVSFDMGETWNIIESSKRYGNLIERFSSDCCQLRTVSGVVCTETFEKANANIEEASLDGELWVQTGRYEVISIIEGGIFECMAANDVKYLGVPYTTEEASNLELYEKTNGSKDYGCWNTGGNANDGTPTNGYDVIGCPNGGYGTTTYTVWLKGSLVNYTTIDSIKREILTSHNPTVTHTTLGINTDIKEIYVSSCASDPFIGGGMSKLLNLKTVHFAPGVSGTLGWDKTSTANGSEVWSFIEELDGLENTNISGVALDAFSHCNNLKTVHLPKTCSYLHGYCFSGCTSLSSVTIDSYTIDSDTGDGNWYYGQFENCKNLKEVTFTNLEKGCIPPHCFGGCTSLSSVTLGNPTCISNYAFIGCSSLTSIDLGFNIESVGAGTFSSCPLTDIWIRNPKKVLGVVYSSAPFPSSATLHVPCNLYIDYKQSSVWSAYDIEPIADGCLQYEWRNDDIQTTYICVGVDKHYQQHRYASDDGETWVMTNTVRTGPLYEANSVSCGYIPTNYKVVLHLSSGTSMAVECNSSTVLNKNEIENYSGSVISAEIGNCVTQLGNSLFAGCSGLTSVDIPNNITTIGTGVFCGCSGLTSCTIGSGVTSIGDVAFSGCTSLSSITIPESTTYIGVSAFTYCSGLTSIDIPNSITSISSYAFRNCSGLNSITVEATTPPILGSNAFYNTNNCTIYVPCGSVDAYKAANNWSSYSSRIVGIPPCYEPQYRTTSGTPYCSSYDKYVDVYDQVSYDRGSTWSTTATTPTLVEANSPDCGFIPTQKDYFSFVAQESGDFWFYPNSIQCSVDSGNTWITLANQQHSPTVSAGSKILWKSTLTPSSGGIGKFYSSGRFTVEGNVMSLLYGDDFEDKTSLSGKNYAFYDLFYGNTKLVSAENLSLPATTLADYCYYDMFYGCTSLTTPPRILPATTLANYCYNAMFYDCTSLTTAPELHASTLADYCYQFMFKGCTSLTTAPELSSTTVGQNSCRYMFSGCTSLTTASSTLLATTLATRCYSYMFVGCTSLTTSPIICATTMASSSCYYMFNGCTNLNSVTCLATNISASMCTYKWLDGVASNGTFTKSSNMSSWTRGSDGIPSGWVVQDY